jgi:glutathione S-transferase
LVAPDNAQSQADLEALWPFRRFPVIVDGSQAIKESTIIIEYLDQHYPGPAKFIPADPRHALEARFMDRFFDNYIMTPMQKIVGNAIRAEADRDAQGEREARQMLDTAYRWLDATLQGREWAAGSAFTLADCAAAPSLFYSDWAHPIGTEFARVRAYRQRLLVRPSFARAVDEARAYRQWFPLGAPDRD